MSKLVPIIVVNYANFKLVTYIISFQNLSASFWRVEEPRANGVENGLCFELSSVSRIIDHNRWEETSAIISPVLDIVVYQ